MLVRAKRLVFVPTDEFCCEYVCKTPFGEYVVEQTAGGEWQALLNGEYVGHVENQRSKVEVMCQRDADARWLSITEVPELVWEEVDCMQRTTKNGYSITCYDDDDWRWSFGMRSGSESTLRLAQAACNTHNRAAILGTTATEGMEAK